MAYPDQPPVTAGALAPPLNLIAELMQASRPLTLGPVLAILFALQINRVRLFHAGQDGYTKVLERRVGGAGLSAEGELEGLTSLDEAVRGAMVEMTKLGSMRSVDIALDLTVGALSADIDADALLEGQDLSTLTSDDPTRASSVPQIELSTDESYLTAAEVAAMLGVAKSTVTRRIEKGDLIGFRGFKKSLHIPKDQFINGDMVAGISEILALFEYEDGGTAFDHKQAWKFLSSTLYPGDWAPRPIDRLRAASRERQTQTIVAELTLVKESLDYGDHI